VNRPDWCPDSLCDFRGGVEPQLCGGRVGGGGRLCICLDAIGVRSLDRITDDELAELQRLLARLYGGAK